MLTGTALLLVVMGRWGWLRAAGITHLGSWQHWLITGGLILYVIVVYQMAFFGEMGLDLLDAWRSEAGQAILRRQAVVGVAEEFLFRGFLLYALVRVWGKTRRGLLAAVSVQALMFGLLHIMQVAGGNPLDDALMTILNALVGGLWLGALVLLGGSIWPAVLIHAVGNAAVQLGALSVSGFDPGVANYALATAAELPVLIGCLWVLLRRTPDSTPIAVSNSAGKATAAASATARELT
jgi:membrane protease YdiL (CAAX protease family)